MGAVAVSNIKKLIDLKYSRFSQKILRNPYWEELRETEGGVYPDSDSEVMYAVLMSILMTFELKEDMSVEHGYLRTFANGLNITARRQREIMRSVQLAHDSGWQAVDTISSDKYKDFVDAYIGICVIDKRLQVSEFRLLHLVCKKLHIPAKMISKQMRNRLSAFRYKAVIFFDRPIISTIITMLIIFNSIQLGLMTSDAFRTSCGKWFYMLDFLFMVIFSIEIICRIFAFRADYFKESQNIFDFCIIAVSWIPAPGFRWVSAFRILRAMLLFNRLKQLKLIMRSLMDALPNIGWVSVLLFIFVYVFSVISTRLFGDEFEMFSTIQRSFFSLFQLMTLEGWPDLVRTVMARYPYAWLLFIPFILVTSYVFLNLVIGIIVTAMQDVSLKKNTTISHEADELKELKEKIQDLSQDIARLQSYIRSRNAAEKSTADTGRKNGLERR